MSVVGWRRETSHTTRHFFEIKIDVSHWRECCLSPIKRDIDADAVPRQTDSESILKLLIAVASAASCKAAATSYVCSWSLIFEPMSGVSGRQLIADAAPYTAWHIAELPISDSRGFLLTDAAASRAGSTPLREDVPVPSDLVSH